MSVLPLRTVLRLSFDHLKLWHRVGGIEGGRFAIAEKACKTSEMWGRAWPHG